jgi:glycosyltransferase involved in cell wall biosynthesis
MNIISVIIPAHNRISMLKTLVLSIPPVKGLEVILVDDHSTDDLSQISLERFEKYKFIRNESGLRYAGTARNVGVEHASGEYVFFADSDDLIFAKGFLNCLKLLHDLKPDILFAQSSSFKDNDGSLGKRHIRNNWLLESVRNGAPDEILARSVVPWGKFIRRDYLIRNAIFFESQRYSNDIVFSASLLIFNPLVRVTDDIVYFVREGNESLTNDSTLESSLIRLEALFRYNGLLKDNGMSYLMVPALTLLLRLYKKDIRQAIVYAWRVKSAGHPVFFTWWTYKNIFLRWRSWEK